jgi:hypothetical protein
MPKIYVGSAAREIILDTGVDITSATACAIEGRRPDFSTFTWPAEVYDTTCVRYFTTEASLNMSGTWTVHASVTEVGGNWLGEAATFEIFDKYN